MKGARKISDAVMEFLIKCYANGFNDETYTGRSKVWCVSRVELLGSRIQLGIRVWPLDPV